MSKQAKLAPPDHLTFLDAVTTPAGEFTLGESVWIDGWRKSPQSENTVHRIVVNDRTGDVHINVFCASRGRGQWHSFAPDRLIKRRQRKRHS